MTRYGEVLYGESGTKRIYLPTFRAILCTRIDSEEIAPSMLFVCAKKPEEPEDDPKVKNLLVSGYVRTDLLPDEMQKWAHEQVKLWREKDSPWEESDEDPKQSL